MRPSVLTYNVTFLRHATSKKKKKKEFLQIVKVKGKTQDQGQIKVKILWEFSLFCTLTLQKRWINEKWKSAFKIFNSQQIPLKIYTHISWTYPMYLAQNCIDQKNVTYVSMATKKPIIKYREFLHISMCYISANNEHSSSKCTPVMHGTTWWMHKNQIILKCPRQGQTHNKLWQSS